MFLHALAFGAHFLSNVEPCWYASEAIWRPPGVIWCPSEPSRSQLRPSGASSGPAGALLWALLPWCGSAGVPLGPSGVHRGQSGVTGAPNPKSTRGSKPKVHPGPRRPNPRILTGPRGPDTKAVRELWWPREPKPKILQAPGTENQNPSMSQGPHNTKFIQVP